MQVVRIPQGGYRIG